MMVIAVAREHEYVLEINVNGVYGLRDLPVRTCKLGDGRCQMGEPEMIEGDLKGEEPILSKAIQ